MIHQCLQYINNLIPGYKPEEHATANKIAISPHIDGDQVQQDVSTMIM